MYHNGRAHLAGNFWDDLYKIGGKVAQVAQGVQQASTAGREVQAGNLQVAVVPTTQGALHYTQEAVTGNLPLLLLGGGALLAVYLAMQPRRRR